MKILLKRFSKLQDEDYIEEQENRKKEVRHAPVVHAVGLGASGGLIGASLGNAAKKSRKGALIGAGLGIAAGAAGGYGLGKFAKKTVEEDANRKIKRYKKADEKDKRYLREKEEKERDRNVQKRQARAQERQAYAQERIAWNTL